MKSRKEKNLMKPIRAETADENPNESEYGAKMFQINIENATTRNSNPIRKMLRNGLSIQVLNIHGLGSSIQYITYSMLTEMIRLLLLMFII